MSPGQDRERNTQPTNRFLLICAAALILAAGALAFFFLWPKTGSLQAPAPSPMLRAQAQGLDSIRITAAFDPNLRQLAVTQEITLMNREEEKRNNLVLRTLANAFQSPDTSPAASEELYQKCYPHGFSSGSLAISSARLRREGEEGRDIQYRYTDEAKTVLLFPLELPWENGQTLILELHYTLTIPRLAGRFGENNGIWALGNAFPLPAVYRDGAYREDPYYAVGDPFISECMNFTVQLSLPQGYTAAGSAWPSVTRQESGNSLYAFEALAVRDFALCLSDGYRLAQAMEDGVLVSAYAKNIGQAREALDFARQALACYKRHFGAYPYPVYTLAQVDFPFGGMEYPSLVMLGGDQLRQGGETLELLVAHETAHQWWYGIVGSDQVNQAWQDEALCEYSLLPYMQDYHGFQAREEIRFSRIETAMRVTVSLGITPGSPLRFFASGSEYATVVYGRGAAFLVALDNALEGRLDDFLKAYYDRYAFLLATRKDFEEELQAFSGEDWSSLMTDYLDTFMIRSLSGIPVLT